MTEFYRPSVEYRELRICGPVQPAIRCASHCGPVQPVVTVCFLTDNSTKIYSERSCQLHLFVLYMLAEVSVGAKRQAK